VLRYRIVPDRSEVRIDATSNLHPIHTRARGLEGYVDLEFHADVVNVSGGVAGELVLAVDRLAGSNPLENRELRRRIDARRFPVIAGRLTALRAATDPSSYRARGEVTFHGVTRPAEDEIRVTSLAGGRLRIEGAHDFDIREFGMEPPHILVLKVEPIVRVHVDIVAAHIDDQSDRQT
jgi:hypothetical protein